MFLPLLPLTPSLTPTRDRGSSIMPFPRLGLSVPLPPHVLFSFLNAVLHDARLCFTSNTLAESNLPHFTYISNHLSLPIPLCPSVIIGLYPYQLSLHHSFLFSFCLFYSKTQNHTPISSSTRSSCPYHRFAIPLLPLLLLPPSYCSTSYSTLPNPTPIPKPHATPQCSRLCYPSASSPLTFRCFIDHDPDSDPGPSRLDLPCTFVIYL